MGGININPFDPAYKGALGVRLSNQSVYVASSISTLYLGTFVDSSNKVFTTLAWLNSGSFFNCYNITYESDGSLTSSTPTIVTGPSAGVYSYAFQGSDGGNYYVIQSATAGGWVVDSIIPVAIDHSAGTVTFDYASALTVPTVAGKTPFVISAYGSVIYVWYYDSATNIADTGRKYDAGWSSLAGDALPTSVDAGIIHPTTPVYYNNILPRSTTCPVNGLLHCTNFQIGGSSVYQYLRFDYATETWAQGGTYPETAQYLLLDVGGKLIVKQINNKIQVMDTSDGTKLYEGSVVMGIPYFKFWDFANGFMANNVSSNNSFMSINFISDEALQLGYLNAANDYRTYLAIVDGEYSTFSVPPNSVDYGDIYRLGMYSSSSMKVFGLGGHTTGTTYSIYNLL